MSSVSEKMDRMYRYQRYFYDATRKYYLLGRDRLIEEIDVQPGERILEIGCGTARNLQILAAKYPDSHFYGLDASVEMLDSANTKIAQNGHANITLAQELAEDFSFESTFSLEHRFDSIFFSYSISMIPTWRESVLNALNNLKPGGSLFIVDFYDQKGLPVVFARILQAWLRQFHVVYPVELTPFLEGLENECIGKLTTLPLFRGYSFLSKFEKVEN